MSRTDLLALAPLLVLAAGACAGVLLAAWRRRHATAAGLCLAVVALAAATLPLAVAAAPRDVGPLFRVDGFALYLIFLLLAAAAVVTLLAHADLERRAVAREELYPLLLIATLGAAALVASRHAAGLFIGLETLTVALYGMIAYARDRRPSLEAGVKYLILAAAASAFLLFGLALLYAATGSLDLERLAGASAAGGPLELAGMALLLVGVGFKLALVPFHLWTPEIYQGAPAPVAAFVATASKGAVLGVLLRWFATPEVVFATPLAPALAALAAAAILGGNLLALLEDDLARLLAYSSIAHLGYMLVAFLAGGEAAAGAVGFYLAVYFAAMLTAFGVLALAGGGAAAGRLEEWRGMAWRRPGLAGLLAVAVLSLAGLPVSAGFMGKIYLVSAGVGAGLWGLVVVLAVGSAVSVYYYLRVLVALVAAGPADGVVAGAARPALLALAALGLVLLLLGLHPAPALELVARLAAGG